MVGSEFSQPFSASIPLLIWFFFSGVPFPLLFTQNLLIQSQDQILPDAFWECFKGSLVLFVYVFVYELYLLYLLFWGP